MTKQNEKISIALTSAIFCSSSVYTSSYTDMNKIDIGSSLDSSSNCVNYENSIVLETNFDDYKFYFPSVLQSAIENAAQRYKIVNKHDYCFNKRSNEFINILYRINPFSEMKISFRDDALKATMNYKDKEITLKYDYDCPDTLLVSCFDSNMHLRIEEFSFDAFSSLSDFI